MVSHSGSVAKIYGGLTGCGKSGNGWMGIAVDSMYVVCASRTYLSHPSDVLYSYMCNTALTCKLDFVS
jgi:hypothetical protein